MYVEDTILLEHFCSSARLRIAKKLNHTIHLCVVFEQIKNSQKAKSHHSSYYCVVFEQIKNSQKASHNSSYYCLVFEQNVEDVNDIFDIKI